MKQPMMAAPLRVPPAQAEALYDASQKDRGRISLDETDAWPGEDWDDDSVSTYRPMPPPPAGARRIAQH